MQFPPPQWNANVGGCVTRLRSDKIELRLYHQRTKSSLDKEQRPTNLESIVNVGVCSKWNNVTPSLPRAKSDIANTAVNNDATVKGFWATDGLQTQSAKVNC